MIEEVWVMTVRPGMDWVGAIARPFLQAAERHGIKLQWLVPDCGATGKAIAVFEWPSHGEREKFASAYPDDFRAIFPKEKDHFELSATEHYYYRVVE